MSPTYQQFNGSAESVSSAAATSSARPSPLLPLILSKADARRAFCLPGTSRRNSIDAEGEVSQSAPVFQPVFSSPQYETGANNIDGCDHHSPVPGSPADSGCDCGVWEPEHCADRDTLTDQDGQGDVNGHRMKHRGGRTASISQVLDIELGEPMF